MRAPRRSRNVGTLCPESKFRVIRNPDSEKKIAMPAAPVVLLVQTKPFRSQWKHMAGEKNEHETRGAKSIQFLELVRHDLELPTERSVTP